MGWKGERSWGGEDSACGMISLIPRIETGLVQLGTSAFSAPFARLSSSCVLSGLSGLSSRLLESVNLFRSPDETSSSSWSWVIASSVSQLVYDHVMCPFYRVLLINLQPTDRFLINVFLQGLFIYQFLTIVA